MQNVVNAGSAAGGISTVDRRLAVEAYSRNFDISAHVPLYSVPDVEAVINRYAESLMPLNRVYPALRGSPGMATEAMASPECTELAEELKIIGGKVRPDFSEEQAARWVGSMILALADLPAPIAIKATREARTKPVEFLGSVEQLIRKEADTIALRHANAMARLRELRETIRRGFVKPTHRLEAPPAPLTQEEISAMAAGADPLGVFKLGLKLGHIIDNGDGTYSAAPEITKEVASDE